MKITTGKLVASTSPTQDAHQKSTSTVGVVLFDDKSTEVNSPVIRITQDRSVVITVYGLTDEDSVQVVKFSPVVQPMASGDGCCDTLIMPFDTAIIRQEVALWTITPTTPARVLTLPGYYRLRLSNEKLVGTVYVVGERIDPVPIPQALVLGGS